MLSEQWEERNKTQFKMKTFIQKVLSFDRGNDRSYGEILGTMDWLDIENAFIFLYKEPIIHLIGEPFELPDQLYLKTKDLKEKVSSVITVNQKVSSSNLYDLRASVWKELEYMYSCRCIPTKYSMEFFCVISRKEFW